MSAQGGLRMEVSRRNFIKASAVALASAAAAGTMSTMVGCGANPDVNTDAETQIGRAHV